MMSGNKPRETRRPTRHHALGLIVAVALAAFVADLALPAVVQAQRRLPTTINYRDRLQHAYAESLRWLASGSIPGTGGIRVDTLIAAVTDTTFPFDYTGAESVVLEIGSIQAGEDNAVVVYRFQFSTSADTNAVWHEWEEEYSISTTNANDTMAVILFSPTFVGLNDTSFVLSNATLETGVTTAAPMGRSTAHNMRYGRVIAAANGAAGDTVLARIIATVRYER